MTSLGAMTVKRV